MLLQQFVETGILQPMSAQQSGVFSDNGTSVFGDIDRIPIHRHELSVGLLQRLLQRMSAGNADLFEQYATGVYANEYRPPLQRHELWKSGMSGRLLQ